VGLGGWGGGHNDAADVVKGAIDRDLAKQQAGVKAAGARVDANNDLWNKLRTLSGDNATAAAAYRATQLSAYASQVEQLAQLQRGADAKTKALQVAQQLRLDSAVENERAQQLLAQQVNSSTTTTSQMVDGATLARGKMEAETDLIKKLTAQQELESKIAKNNPENPTDADEARATKAAAETGKWLGAYNTVEDLAKQVAKANYLARKSGFGESGAAFDAQKAMVKSQLTTAITGAAASPEQEKDIKAMLEGPINTYDQLQARLRQVRQAIAGITSGHYAGVHDTIRQRTLENVIKQGRISPHNARALFYGGDIQDTASEGEALGGKPYSR
jgi:Asp-tRNA(Asn)/Glu-tRNA(Gln) amidotransferase C subunit